MTTKQAIQHLVSRVLHSYPDGEWMLPKDAEAIRLTQMFLSIMDEMCGEEVDSLLENYGEEDE